jgi:hypothetical protein
MVRELTLTGSPTDSRIFRLREALLEAGLSVSFATARMERIMLGRVIAAAPKNGLTPKEMDLPSRFNSSANPRNDSAKSWLFGEQLQTPVGCAKDQNE